MNLTKRDDGSTGYPCEKGHEHGTATVAGLCDLGAGHGPEKPVDAGQDEWEWECSACGSTTAVINAAGTFCVEDEAARAWQARRKTCRK